MSIPHFCLESLLKGVSYFFPAQEDIMQEIPAFGSCEWQKLGLDVNAPPIPKKIQEYLDARCPFWPGKVVRETHFLCLIPGNLTLEGLYELTSSKSHSPFIKHATDYSERPYWVLITKKTIPDSIGLDFERQKELVSRYNYEIPTILVAATTVVAAKSCNFVINPSPGQFTRCKTKDNDWPIAIGNDGVAPFSITSNDCNRINGTAGIYVVGPETA